jgi:hypothetical protein
MPNDHHDGDFQGHLFDGPVWDDPEDVEPDATSTSAEGDEDDVEGHASGFG